MTEWSSTLTERAVVRDSGVATFYVNGVAVGSTSTASPINATEPLLAVNAGGQAYFSGDVSEARIFTFDPGQFNVSNLLYPGTGPAIPMINGPPHSAIRALMSISTKAASPTASSGSPVEMRQAAAMTRA